METMKALRQVIVITLGVVVSALMLTTMSHGTDDDCQKPEWTLVAGPGEQPVVRIIKGAAVTRDTITLEPGYSLVMKDGNRVTILDRKKQSSGEIDCSCTSWLKTATKPSGGCDLGLGTVTKNALGESYAKFTCTPKGACQTCGRGLFTPEGGTAYLP